MDCPIDGIRMRKRAYEGSIEVDACTTCDGIWLDKGELEQIQKTVERDYHDELGELPKYAGKAYALARGAHEERALRCPSCDDEELVEKEHGYCSQIMVDVCPGCGGVWLDAGELAALEVFFERASADPGLRKGFWASLSDLIRHGIVPD